MNKLIGTSLFALCFFIVSCGTQKKAVIPEISSIIWPTENEINSGQIGNTFVFKEKGSFYNAIKLTKDFTTKVGYQVKTIKAGSVFINYYNTKKYHLYKYPKERTFGLVVPRNGKSTMVYNNYDPNGIYTTRMSGNKAVYKTFEEKIEYVKFKSLVKQSNYDYLKQELVYNGRIGDGLKFIYREYINDYVRPAFTQELQYDLTESDTIGFRELRVQVINATNTSIEYKVLNHFDK